MEIDDPVAVLAHSFPCLGTFVAQMVNALPGVESGIRRQVHGAETEGAVAGLDGEPGAIFDAHALGNAGDHTGSVIALAIVTNHASE